MARKVRKQIYLEQRQQQRLRRLAEARGVSQAELIRQALDRETQGELTPTGDDLQAWEQAVSFMRNQRERLGRRARGRRPARDELYEERVERRGNHSG